MKQAKSCGVLFMMKSRLKELEDAQQLMAKWLWWWYLFVQSNAKLWQ
jgi:hypothetical protein